MFQIFGIGPLTWITFLPLLGMILILLIPSGKDERSKDVSKSLFRWVTIIFTFLQLLLAIWIYANYNYYLAGINDPNGFQFVDKFKWIYLYGLPLLGNVSVDYFVGIDGISAPMVLLTAIVCFVASFSSFSVTKALKGYFAMFLLLDTGMMGVFVTLDFFLFYIFWELMLLPMYFLIGIWGGPRKEYAAIKFFIYTLFGSVFILLVMIGLYFSATELMTDGSKVHTFSLIALMNPANYSADGILSALNPSNLRLIAYIALFAGFAIKIPMFPFHTWLPDAHVEAPTPISVILAGVLLKMGTYVILRFNFQMLPDAAIWAATGIAIFGTINIVYAAFVCLAQKDLKKMIAYSSVSHMGFVLLGMAAMTPQSMVGAVFQMFSHGLVSPMLFLVAGVIYDRAHTRDIEGFGGLAKQVPEYTGIMGLAFMASLGLPGLAGFIGEFLVFLGSFGTFRIMTIIAATSVVITAAYYLWTIQRMFLGKLNEKWSKLWDMDWRERSMLYSLGVLVIFFGFYPLPVFKLMNTSLIALVEMMRGIQ